MGECKKGIEKPSLTHPALKDMYVHKKTHGWGWGHGFK
jgi:hypothetical protein